MNTLLAKQNMTSNL